MKRTDWAFECSSCLPVTEHWSAFQLSTVMLNDDFQSFSNIKHTFYTCRLKIARGCLIQRRFNSCLKVTFAAVITGGKKHKNTHNISVVD